MQAGTGARLATMTDVGAVVSRDDVKFAPARKSEGMDPTSSGEMRRKSRHEGHDDHRLFEGRGSRGAAETRSRFFRLAQTEQSTPCPAGTLAGWTAVGAPPGGRALFARWTRER